MEFLHVHKNVLNIECKQWNLLKHIIHDIVHSDNKIFSITFHPIVFLNVF